MKKKVLITGGAGFIGSNLKESLKELDHEVLTIGRDEKEDIKIDLNDTKLQNIVQDFLPDIVCHFASGSNIVRAEEDREKEFKETVSVTNNLINSLSSLRHGKSKFIYLSSQAVYGVPQYLPVNESHLLKPNTIYGENKLKAENIIVQNKTNYIIFRVSSVYGMGQNYNKSGVISKFINKLENNLAPVVFNSSDLICDFIYVTDLVNAVIKGIQDDSVQNEIFNLSSGKPTTLKELLDILYKYFPRAPLPELKANSLYLSVEQKGIYLDNTKIQTQLKWSCKYSVGDGLKEMLDNVKLKQRV